MEIISVLLAVTMLVSPAALNHSDYNESISYCTHSSSVADNQILMLKSSDDMGAFSYIGGYPSKAKILDSIDGYAYYNLEIFKVNYSDKSNMFLIHVETEFTPGVNAVLNGETQYNGSMYLGEGYVHITPQKYYVSSSKHGADLVSKSFWPKSSNFSTTVTSSFGGSFSVSRAIASGGTLSLNEGVSLSQSNSTNAKLTLNYSKSLSTLMDDPFISTQTASNNYDTAEWSYQVVNFGVAGAATYTLNTYCMFELNDSSYLGTNCDAFNLKLDFMSRARWHYVFFVDQYSAQNEYTSSCNVGCFL